MKDEKKKQSTKRSGKVRGILLSLCLVVGVCAAVYANAEDNDRKLKNGSFEEGQTWTNAYSQPDQSAVPWWNTTAFQGKIELFRKNIGTYINNVTLEPTAGTYAAELNADEDSGTDCANLF